jgi:acetyl esterase
MAANPGNHPGPPQEGRLDPEVEAFLAEIAQPGGPTMADLEPAEVRDQLAAYALATAAPREPIANAEDRSVPGPAGPLTVRLYTPESVGPLPVLVWFHGGGFVAGDLEMQDDICRSLSNAGPCLVVSVEYRLAPEHRFPAGAEDAYAATLWTAENAAAIGGDATRIAVGGESAGGNLAAAVSLMARDRGFPALCYQLLVNACTSFVSFDTDSYDQFAVGYGLTRRDVEWVRSHYLAAEEDRRNPYASPLLADDLTRRLQEAGVSAKIVRYHGMIHGFLAAAGIFEQGKEARAMAARALRDALGAH